MITTVRQMLQDVARPIVVALTTNPGVSTAEQNVAGNAVPVIDSVLADLNANNIIPNTGRRNAAVTNLRDNALVPLEAVDAAHPNFATTRLYDAVDAINDAITLIARQVGSDDVTY